jgi:hypothetical protein
VVSVKFGGKTFPKFALAFHARHCYILLKMKGVFMEAALLDLSHRVERLERSFYTLQFERGDLRDIQLEPEQPLTPAERGKLLIESARRNAVRDSMHFRQVMNEMGITDDIPLLSRKELQRLYLEAGFDPEANDFAQGIVAMREE